MSPKEKTMETEFKKPACKLTGTNGNVFSIIRRVSKTLKQSGRPEQAKEFCSRAMECSCYDAVLQLCFAYVDVR